MEVEQFMTITEIAKLYNLPSEFVRAACKRTEGNILPCVNVKRKPSSRDYFLIRPSAFREWLTEEERVA